MAGDGAKFTHQAKHLMLSLLMCHPFYNYISEWRSRDRNLSSSSSLTEASLYSFVLTHLVLQTIVFSYERKCSLLVHILINFINIVSNQMP